MWATKITNVNLVVNHFLKQEVWKSTSMQIMKNNVIYLLGSISSHTTFPITPYPWSFHQNPKIRISGIRPITITRILCTPPITARNSCTRPDTLLRKSPLMNEDWHFTLLGLAFPSTTFSSADTMSNISNANIYQKNKKNYKKICWLTVLKQYSTIKKKFHHEPPPSSQNNIIEFYLYFYWWFF